MKKGSMFLLILALLFAAVPVVQAESNESTVEILCYEDGSYCVTVIEYVLPEESGEGARTENSISGSKSYNYYSSSNVLQYTVYVYGTFTFNGASSMAVDASYNYSISNHDWTFVSGYAYFSGASATASCTFTHPAYGNKTTSCTLTCDRYGNLS